MSKNLLVRFVIDQAVRLAGTGVALFWPAGTIRWWPAWGFIAVSAAWITGTAVVIQRRNPDLFAERLAPPKGAKQWDIVLMSAHGLLQMAIYIIAGIDRRFGWTDSFPFAVQLAALAACAIGYAAAVWATACNPFFSLIVRIQTERSHTVATGGPYRWLRHPSNAGGLLIGASLGVLLGSWWALLPGSADALLMVLRTALEDRALQQELPGYADYARQVPHRLVPGVW